LLKKLIAFILITLVFAIPIHSSISFSETYDLSYDLNGNIVNDKKYYYEYDSFNNLIKIRKGSSSGNSVEEYFYDGEGNRIKKIEHLSNGETNTYYYIGNDFVRKVNSTGSYDIIYLYDGDSLVAKNDSGVMKFFHPDHLGSTTLVTDKDGEVVEDINYYPFGAEFSGASSEERLFTGKEKDSTGIYYYGARYYSPLLRQFTQPDSMLPDIYDPQQLNRYSYARNNPVKYVDPTGNWIDTVIDIASIGWDIKSIAQNPKDWKNWAALGADVVCAAIPFVVGGGLLVKAASKGDDVIRIVGKVDDVNDIHKAIKSTKIVNKGTKAISKGDEVIKVPLKKLYGHATDDSSSLFKIGAKTHNKNPIEVIKIGEEYMISDGVGRSMRAYKKGEKVVNAKVLKSYSNVDDLSKKAISSGSARLDKHWWNNLVTKIDDPNRWKKLFGR